MTGRSPKDQTPPPAPEPLAVPVLDSHTHLDLQDGTVAEALETAAAVGVRTVVQVGTDVASSRWGAEQAANHDALWATVALHPNEAPLLDDLDAALAQIDELATREQVVGIGETGLDYFRTTDAGRPAQHAAFRGHIEIAKRHNRALMIHDRDAHADVLRILDEQGAPERVILHCFSGDVEFAQACAQRGYFTSFAGNVTFTNAKNLHAAAAAMPQELLLTETDGPFLTPVPYRGRPNAPYLLPITVRYLAALRETGLDRLCTQLWINSQRAFVRAF
ncbi:MAG: TatD family hydrolase [Mycobacteriales bacterium]